MGNPSLTVQEIESSHLARYDLGPGYPQMPVSEYIRRLYRDDTLEEVSLRFAPDWSTEEQGHLDQALLSSLYTFLDIDDRARARILGTSFTFSGSIALDRAIAAAARLAREGNRTRTVVVTTSPCIDIMKLFLGERPSIEQRYVRSQENAPWALDARTYSDAIRQAMADHPGSFVVGLITSPENPTGNVWTASDLRTIGQAVADTGGLLIVDHSFMVSGVQADRVPRVWEQVRDDCDWISVWDTGKTFGLNEDKIGVVFCGSAKVQQAMDASISVLQFGIARRQKLFFSKVFEFADYNDHLAELRKTCEANLARLCASASECNANVHAPIAGTLALLDVSGFGLSDEAARQLLLANGVGVVAANVFFHDGVPPDSHIRIALARATDYFEEATAHLFSVLQQGGRRA